MSKNRVWIASFSPNHSQIKMLFHEKKAAQTGKVTQCAPQGYLTRGNTELSGSACPHFPFCHTEGWKSGPPRLDLVKVTFPFKKDILSETHTLFHLGSFVLKNITLIITACKRLSLPFSIVCVCGGPQRPEESNMSPQLESPDKGAGPKLRSSGKRSSLNHLVTSPAPRCCLFYQAFLWNIKTSKLSRSSGMILQELNLGARWQSTCLACTRP